MSMLSNLDLIRRVPLFSMLTAEQAQGIADSVVKRRFRRGELVVEQGRKSNALFILLNGRARVLTSDTRGREVILAVLESGDYVGEMSSNTWPCCCVAFVHSSASDGCQGIFEQIAYQIWLSNLLHCFCHDRHFLLFC